MPRILVVEDEAIIAEAIEDLLTRNGHSVVAALASEEETLAWVQSHDPPDLALVDIRIRTTEPSVGSEPGVRLAEELWVCDRIPVVFVTAFPDLVTRKCAGDTGVFGVVGKPFSPDALLAQVNVTLERANKTRV